MNQNEWVEAFKAINGRNPSPEEFSVALQAGEFILEGQQPQYAESDMRGMENSAKAQGPQNTAISQKEKLFNVDLKALNKDIEEMNHQLAQKFFELGLAYYNQQINQTDSNLEPSIHSILESHKKSYELRQLYNQYASREKTCLACGVSLGVDSRFCPSCGSDVQELDALETATIKSCSICEVEQAGKNTFCVCCGKLFK